MVVAIIRVVVAIGSGNGVDSSWLYTWGPIEQATGMLSSNPERPDLKHRNDLT